MNNFYLTLLSDSSLSIYPKNQQSDFTVKLDRAIQIDKDQWEVGLVELITPTEVKNITKKNNFFFVKLYDSQLCEDVGICSSAYNHRLTIETGFYKSPQHLVKEIQYQIDTWIGDYLKKRNASVYVTYEETRGRVKLGFQDSSKISLEFPKPLAEILGMDLYYANQPLDDSKRYIFRYGVDLNTEIHQLFVYSDIASYTILGDVTAPILRVVPFKNNTANNQSHLEFVNVHYVPVAKSFIDQVQISIKGGTGEDVPFISGKTLVKLHFRQKQ